MFFLFKFTSDLNDKINSANLKIHIFGVEVKYVTERQKKLLEIVKTSIEDKKGFRYTDKNKLDIWYTDSEFKQMLKEAIEVRKELEIKSQEVKSEIEGVDYLSRFKVMVNVVFGIVVAISFLLARFGFYRWYHYIQKYQDMAIKQAGEIKDSSDIRDSNDSEK